MASSNLEVLHMRWSAVKANYGPLLGSLRPIAARVRCLAGKFTGDPL